ncbi:MAG TPA: PEP/pyruvate-binding domain-containing protein, partial [Propionibacteriaceae bacterium]
NRLSERILPKGAAAAPRSSGVGELFETGTLPDGLGAQISAAYDALGRPPVAVRSSATAEDLAEASFAGQQDSFLNVRGDVALLAAVRRCWASLWNERAVDYRARQSIDSSTLSLAVVVQQMVPADAAGVLFTANPTNGQRQQTVIAAAWGLGESVVSGTVNTDVLVVNNVDGTVVSRSIADKAVLTRYAAVGTIEADVPTERRREPVLDDASALELTRLGSRIEAHFGAPQDIEWARTGGAFAIVQARPITALPPPEADPPTDWGVPDRTAMYARASIVEQLPNPLTPLFADLVNASVTRSLQALFNELVGEGVVREEDVSLPTVNGYAYYRYSRSGMARLTLRSGKAFQLLLAGREHGSQARWRDYAHPRYADAVARWVGRDLDQLSAGELLDGVVELLDAGTEYYTAVQTIIPIAVTSEALFTTFYDRFVRRPGEATAATFLLGFDSLPIRGEKSLFDLASWARSQPGLASDLLATPTSRLVAILAGAEPMPPEPTWAGWWTRFQTHLDLFGHLVYNLDFANAVPADDPGPLLDTLRFYLRGEGRDPHLRQQASIDRREQQTQAVLARLGPVRGWVFHRLLRWAQQVAPVREDALGDVGLAWPQMRRMLGELGGRLVSAGALKSADEVFWLRRDEIRVAMEATDPGRDQAGLAGPAGLSGKVSQRQELYRGRSRVTPPQVLPEYWLRVFGRLLPATNVEQSGAVLTGVAAGGGRVTAPARVLTGPQDFDRLQAGDVLVAAITTPAWTPLFARAAAIVTDIGGPLSHSSIVAREYGIPAVLGTGVATRWITSGQLVTVDGNTGEVLLTAGAAGEASEGGEPAEAAPPAPLRRGRSAKLAAAGLVLAGVIRAMVRRAG